MSSRSGLSWGLSGSGVPASSSSASFVSPSGKFTSSFGVPGGGGGLGGTLTSLRVVHLADLGTRFCGGLIGYEGRKLCLSEDCTIASHNSNRYF